MWSRPKPRLFVRRMDRLPETLVLRGPIRALLSESDVDRICGSTVCHKFRSHLWISTVELAYDSGAKEWRRFEQTSNKRNLWNLSEAYRELLRKKRWANFSFKWPLFDSWSRVKPFNCFTFETRTRGVLELIESVIWSLAKVLQRVLIGVSLSMIILDV